MLMHHFMKLFFANHAYAPFYEIILCKPCLRISPEELGDCIRNNFTLTQHLLDKTSKEIMPNLSSVYTNVWAMNYNTG